MFENIIIADGNAETRYWFYEILSSLAYKVVSVPNSNELLLRMEKDRPTLIIIDEKLPRPGALETIKKIREFETETKIIVLTDREIDGTALTKSPLGITSVLKKDFSNHMMMKKILEVLKQTKAVTAQEKRQGNILVIDDELEIRKLLSIFLEKKGYKVTMVGSGEEALNEVKTRKPDLILCDVRMPGMDGLVILRSLKGLDESLKVIMLTAVQDKDIAAEAFKEGALDYLIKPFDLNKLDALVSSLLATPPKQFNKEA